MISLTLNAAKVKPILFGHPWVFPKAISNYSATPDSGELVQVLSPEGECIGYGVFNAASLYRVRMLSYAAEDIAPELSAIVSYRLRQAWDLRARLNLPNEFTTAFRWCNSEGDGLSGLTIDVFHDVAVVSSSAYWVEQHRALIEACLRDIMKPAHILWRSQGKPLQQDGWTDVDEDPLHEITQTVLENGIQFSVDFRHTQKTGLFLDQRDNHRRIAELSRGKRVLDLYCYTGGFALHAAKAGAAMVTAVDSSAPAIEQAQANAAQNGLTNVNFIHDDAKEYLARAGDYDIIILDPPKLAPSRAHIQKASSMYRFLHREIFHYLKPNALLFTCSCSSAMTLPLFLQLINYSAQSSQRHCRILGTFGASGDHTMLPGFSEGNYLQGVLLTV